MVNIRTAPLTLEPKNKIYNCIDLMKFICSLLIVTIHMIPSNIIFVTFITRTAVPFYFICSGFLVFRGMNIKNLDKKKIINYTIRILKLYIIWNIIYLPVVLLEILKSDNISYEIINRIYRFIIVGDYWHLWYLHATVIAVWLIYFTLKLFKSIKVMFIISLTLYIVGLIPQSYWGVFSKFEFIRVAITHILEIFKTTRNGIFFGFLFICLGSILAMCPIKIRICHANILLIISSIFYFIEVYLLISFNIPAGYDMWLFTIPVSFLLFYLISHIDLKDSIIWKDLRKIGMIIFYSHILISAAYGFLNTIISSFMQINILPNDYVRLFFVVTTSFVLSLIIVNLSKLKHFKWINYII